jgi:tetratricopeptide (TPR) repeat protein
MAQLAGSELTRQAIFLVESGKARPSMRTLEFIAQRTGKSVESFLKPPTGSKQSKGPVLGDSRVEELQALCLQQQFEKAIALGLSLLQNRMPAKAEAHVRHYVGQALVRSMQPDQGLDHLRRAQALLEQEPDPWLAAECADWEACALYLKEDKRALSVAEHALKLCRSTQPRLPGTEARILEHIATIHVKNHAFDRAITFYEEALQAAGTMRDLPRLGRTYHGLGIAYQERGDIGRAIEYTHKALALYALEHDTALLARGENELGLLLMKGGQLARAEESFRTALVHFADAGTERAKSHVLVSLGELLLRSGRHDDAMQTAKEAIDLAKRLDERLAQADGHVLLAQLYERVGRHEPANKEFGLALRLLTNEGQSDRLAEVHASYAEVLEARGDERRASQQWKKAANLALHKQAGPLRPARAAATNF